MKDGSDASRIIGAQGSIKASGWPCTAVELPSASPLAMESHCKLEGDCECLRFYATHVKAERRSLCRG